MPSLLAAPAHASVEYVSAQDKEPSNAVELAVQQILARMAQHGCDVGALKAAEWWAHERGATDAHQLHFDLDESRLGAGPAKCKLSHPVCAILSRGMKRLTAYPPRACRSAYGPQCDRCLNYTCLGSFPCGGTWQILASFADMRLPDGVRMLEMMC